MAELATIARPYAEALFQVARKSGAGGLEAVAQQVDELAQVAAQAALRQFAEHPLATSDQVFEVASGVLKTPLGDVASNFLRVLLDNGRLNALPEVAAQFTALKNKHAGVLDATVESAYPIDEPALAQLNALLEQRFGRKLKAKVQLVPELIGGIRVVVGDEVLDTSVRARLEQMKAALMA
jgi:F-type H+-transporting ATPase subunit delta